jgi:hypothetical protein
MDAFEFGVGDKMKDLTIFGVGMWGLVGSGSMRIGIASIGHPSTDALWRAKRKTIRDLELQMHV